jgi:hypothetical protein
MAASLAFGLLFATVVVLVMVPTVYQFYARVVGVGVEPLQAYEISEAPPELPAAKPIDLDLDQDEVEVLSS